MSFLVHVVCDAQTETCCRKTHLGFGSKETAQHHAIREGWKFITRGGKVAVCCPGCRGSAQ